MTEPFDIIMELDVRVPMRDGVTLSSDIYRPDAPGAFPTVLMRTPYSNNIAGMIEKARRLANHGYVCVAQDVRGRWDSDGTYYPFREGPDGYDTQEWIGLQSWSDGTIGMSGASYLGTVQWQSAPFRSEHLKCIAPRVICCDYYDGLIYPGGALQLNVAMTWGMRTNARTGQDIDYHNWNEAFRSLPLGQMDELAGRDLPFWKDWMEHDTYDAYWQAMDDEQRWDEISVPALNMGGWYDLYAPQTFTNFNGLRLNGRTPEARQSKLIVGPWPHSLSASTRTGDVDFGDGSLVDLEALEMRWFDYWQRGIENGIADEPPIRLFIMGANVWHDEYEWPLARTDWQEWYLHSNGSANTLLGDGVLSTDVPLSEPNDQFIFDPAYPVQTLGGNNCCSPDLVPWGPHDQRPAEMRSDVLCYSSMPLEEDLEVTGPIRMILHAATDGPDTDWTVKLVDVSPSGYAMNLCDGIIRGRLREDRCNPVLLEPDQVYRYEIEVGVTGNVFRSGHRIRVEISSSNFPRFDRNHNTGKPAREDTELRQARQTICHSDIYPSHLVLPVIPVADYRGAQIEH